MEDARLLEAIRTGAPGAFDAFVEAYGRRLMAFGRRMCGQQEDAEDVFQETLLKAYRRLEELRDPGALRTWLFRVAANQCRMKRRKEVPGRELSFEEVAPPGWGEKDPGELAELRDWSALPEDEAQRAEVRQLLEAALQELPPEIRMVVLLRDVEGLSTEETAGALGLGISAVKMRLHRGRLALRRSLDTVLGAARMPA